MKFSRKKVNVIIDCLYFHIKRVSKEYGHTISNKTIDYYLELEPKKSSIKELYKEFIRTLQNSNMMPNVIDFEALKKGAFVNYNCLRIVNEYGNNSSKFLRVLKKQNPRVKPRSRLWRRFAGGVLDGAKFLLQFRNIRDFARYLKPHATLGPESALLLAESIGSGCIRGMRLALAMDFLKNSGTKLSGYCVKPDVHLLKTFPQLGFVDPKLKGRELEVETIRVVHSLSRSSDYSCFAIDKLFWLANSGDFYDHKKFGRVWPKNQQASVRERLIETIRTRLGAD
jgi:hypothetical protein